MKKKYVPALIGAILLFAALLLVVPLLKKDDKSVEGGALRIGIAVYKGNDTFVSNIYGSIGDVAGEYEKSASRRVYLNIADAQESQATQNEQIARYISLGYDVLCVNLVDRTDAATVIDMAREANIPIVFFNREPVKEDMQKWDRIIYVGSDARESAELEGEIVVGAYKNNPQSIDKNNDGIIQYIMLEGESRHQDALIRTEVSVQYMKNRGFVLEKIDGGIANWSRSQSAALSEIYFNKYGDQIELIICNNDDMALGAADTVEKLGLDFNNIVGIDGTPQGLEAVAKRKMLGTVVVDYHTQADMIFKLAVALEQGADPSSVVKVQSDGSVRAPMYIETMSK
ncbi:MAG: galactose ABC transporter substrate-binding protein [Oscillospiraceae bacterium]